MVLNESYKPYPIIVDLELSPSIPHEFCNDSQLDSLLGPSLTRATSLKITKARIGKNIIAWQQHKCTLIIEEYVELLNSN